MVLRYSLLFAALLVATGARAEGYIGVGAGKAYGDAQNFGTGGITGLNLAKSHSGEAFKVFGGYRFNRFIGVEAAYTDLGSFHYSYTANSGSLSGTSVDTQYHVSAVSLAAVGTIPFGNFSLLGKLGVSSNNAENTTAGTVRSGGVSTPLSTSEDKRKTQYTAGIGVSYAFNKNFAVRAEYEYFGKVGDGSTGKMKDLRAATVGLVYSF